MNTGQSLKKNYILNVFLRASQVIIPLITFPYVSRVLQPETLGRVTFAESFVFYLTLLTQLGIPVYGIRACARVRDEKDTLSRTVCELMGISLTMAAVSYGILAAAMLVSPRIGNDRALFLIFSLEIIAAAADISWMYQGLEQYSFIAVRTVSVRILSACLIFLFVRGREQFLVYALILASSSVLTQLVNLLHAGKYISFRLPDAGMAVRHLKPVMVFFAMVGATAVYTTLDKVMLGFMAGNAAVGWYSVAVKIKHVLYLCVSSLTAVLLPRSSYYVEVGKTGEFSKLSGKALNYAFVAAVPLAVFFFLYAEEAVQFLSGSGFLPAVLPIRIIMPGVIMIGISNVLTVQVLIPLGKEKTVLCSNVTGAAVDVVLNTLLIPRFGAAGAAAGTLAAEVGVLTVLLKGAAETGILRDGDGEKNGFAEIQYIKIAAGVVSGTAAAWSLHAAPWGLFPKLTASAALFFGVYCLVLLLLREKLVTEVFTSFLSSAAPRWRR